MNRQMLLMLAVSVVCLRIFAAGPAEAAWTITVTAPPPNAVVLKGEPTTIGWTNQGYAGQTVAITLQEIATGTSQPPPRPISSSAPNTGSYSWTIPSTLPTGRYKIKVTGIGGGNPSDYGDIFEIKERMDIFRKVRPKPLAN